MHGHLVEIEVIRDFGLFLELKPEWDALLSRMGDAASVFMSHYWYECWLRHFCGEAKLHVLILRRGGVIVGIVPLIQRRISLYGLPVRSLCFPENGNSLHNDLLLAPDQRMELLTELLRFLYCDQEGWDVVHLYRMPADSSNLAMLLKLLTDDGTPHAVRSAYASPYLLVSGGWEAFHASRSKRVKKTLRHDQNSLLSAGSAEVLQLIRWDEYLAHRESIYQVARNSWTEKVGNSLASPVNRAFFDDLSRKAAEAGGLRIALLNFNGRPIAFEFHLRGFGKQHAMRASYDREFATLSPGTFLEMEVLKRLYDEPAGVTFYDFGGSSDPYKRRWTDEARELVLLQVFNKRAYSRLCRFYTVNVISFLRGMRKYLRKQIWVT